MLDTIYTEVLATFDTEYFIDQRARRPIARIVDGITTELTWRRSNCASVETATARTSSFSWVRAGLPLERLRRRRHRRRRRFDVRLVVGLGPFPLRRHTPVRCASSHGSGTSAHLLARVEPFRESLKSPRHQFALELGFAEVDMEIVTLWPECPLRGLDAVSQASAALIDGLASIAGLTLDAGSLRASAEEARQRVDDS